MDGGEEIVWHSICETLTWDDSCLLPKTLRNAHIPWLGQVFVFGYLFEIAHIGHKGE